MLKKTFISSLLPVLLVILSGGLAQATTVTVATFAEPVRIMLLGDSITFGVGSTNNNGYRKPLYQALTDAGYDFDFVGGPANGDFPDPDHEGHSGWHAAGGPGGGLLPNVHNWLTANPADIVLLHIGTNDITVGGQNANEVSDILEEIDRFSTDFSTDVKVILALIIDRQPHDPNPATTHFNIDVSNMAQNRIAAGDDIIVVDMEHALNYATDMADNLHPNDAGYAKMANVWYNALVTTTTTPEPATICLLGLGALSLLRRKRKA